jgi:hypothetical protein
MSLEGETRPNSNVLFPIVFENEASTPLYMATNIISVGQHHV